MNRRPTPRTIVIEPTRLDYSGASVFGPTVLLFQRGDARPGIYHPELGDAVWRRLDEIEYDPDVDYLVLVGQTLIVNVAVAAIASRFGSFRALAFNSQDDSRGYEPVVLGSPFTDADADTDTDTDTARGPDDDRTGQASTRDREQVARVSLPGADTNTRRAVAG